MKMTTKLKGLWAAVILMLLMVFGAGGVFATPTAQPGVSPTSCIWCPAPMPTSEALPTPVPLP